MKKIVYRVITKYGLFAERVYNKFGIEIFPLKWRAALSDFELSVLIPEEDRIAMYESGGDIGKYLAWKCGGVA